MKKNRIYLIVIGLALLGVYLYRNRKKPPVAIVTPNLPSEDVVVSGNNPINTATEELVGVTTNPTEVTDFTADQTTTCYTGCPNVQAVSVINGSCEENGLLDFAPPCAPPNNNVGINGSMVNTDDRVTGGTTPVPNFVTDTPMETDNLGYASSGVNVNSGVGCGSTNLAQQVIDNNFINLADTNTQVPSSSAIPFENTTIVDGTLINPYTNQAYAEGSGLVSVTGLPDDSLPFENVLPETEVNQESTGVFDFNSGISNALDSDL